MSWRRRRLIWITFEPMLDVIPVELLSPDHSGERLPHYLDRLRVSAFGSQRCVVLISLTFAEGHEVVEVDLLPPRVAGVTLTRRPEAQAQFHGLSGGDRHLVPPRSLGADVFGVHRVGATQDVVVDAVLRIGRRGLRLLTPDCRRIGFVVAEQGGWLGTIRRRPCRELIGTGAPVLGAHRATGHGDGRHRPAVASEIPGVSKPHVRKHVQSFGVRTGIRDANPHGNVSGMRLGVVNVNNPVPILVEDARVEQLVLSLRTIPRGVRAAQVVVRKFPLRVVVSPTQPRVRGSGIAVPPILLGVFAVVALRTRQSEHPLLEVRVTAVPQCEAHTQVLPEGGDTRHAVFVPPIGARHRVVVREVVPGITVSGIVLAHRSPRTLRKVRAPLVPRSGIFGSVQQPSGIGHTLALAHCAIMPPPYDPWVNSR